jgi:hypothetical protein
VKTTYKIILSALLLLSSVLLFSARPAEAANEKQERLLFPAEKNNIQVFAQRFEYSLTNKSQFRIGDILVDSAEIDVRLVSAGSNRYRFFFRWPGDLVKEGDLLIQDNTGKTLWAQKFAAKDVRIGASKLPKTEESANYRTSVASFQSTPVKTDFLDQLQFNAFFRFCVRKEEKETRIYICSKDLFIKKNAKGGYAIQNRESFRKESSVDINGRPVDPSGIIFLNEVTDGISLRALMESGARLEVDTRRKAIAFQDVVLSDNGKSIVIRAHGTEPVNPALVKRKGPEDWEATVSVDRPIIYLKGEGNIPMLQEFLVQGKVRPDTIRVDIVDGAEPQTYSSSMDLTLKPVKGLTLAAKDKKTTWNNPTWSLLDFEKGKTNKRYLDVTSADGKFVAAYEAYRGFPFELRTRLMFPLFSQTQFSWWLGPRLGFDLNYDKTLSKAATDPDWTNIRFDLLYRFTPGMQGKDPTMGALLFYNQFKADASISLLGVGFFFDMKSPWAGPIHWLQGRFNLPVAKSGTSLALKTSYDIEVSAKHFTSDTLFFDAGLRTMKYSLAADLVSFSYSKTLIFAGAGILF